MDKISYLINALLSHSVIYCYTELHSMTNNSRLSVFTEFLLFIERNGLSFIETSALDSTNVETAFHNILTGK